jgi:RNA polymerase sigma-54 factor
MKTGLQLKLGQHLALTPQLQQSIRLLQLSTLELSQEIDLALADNPLLERIDDPLAAASRIAADGALLDRRVSGANNANGADDADGEPSVGADGADAADGDQGAADEAGYLDWGGGHGAAAADEEDERGPAVWVAAGATLAQHLREQLGATQATPKDRTLVELLIEALDDNGHLTSTLEEILHMCPPQAQVELGDLTAALRLLQSFDPPGVGARDVTECLSLQLEELGRQQKSACPPRALQLAQAIVRAHLPLLASRNYAKLCRLLAASDDELRRAEQLIRGLNPYPGAGFGEQTAAYVTPDVHVRRVKGKWAARLNPETMPRLRLDRSFADLVRRERGQEGNGAWSARLQEARWLIRNIQQRYNTILRVSQAIVERQQGFFNHGAVAMRPLILREIAEKVDLHESTVSRVTTGKYMSTPFGILELKYFFGSHVATEAGGAASSTAIRAFIKQLIGGENPKDPLTDSRIAELLGEQGFVVARRTVAKYREALKIAAVTLRKQL